jgi:hypothetical protein
VELTRIGDRERLALRAYVNERHAEVSALEESKRKS